MRHLTKLKRLPRYIHWNQLPIFKHDIKTIKRANRNHSRKVNRSNNRVSARRNLACKHRKIANQRQEFHWKLVHQLTDRCDWISLETLNLQGMKSLWGRKVSDLGFSDFVSKLKYIAAKKGVKLVFIDKWYPSSKTCSACGAVNEALNLRDRTWQCPSCHTQLDRDRNAAINIHRVGASTLAGRGRKIPMNRDRRDSDKPRAGPDSSGFSPRHPR